MSKKENQPYKSYLVLYFVVSAAVSAVAAFIRHPSLFKAGHSLLQGVEIVGIVLVALALLIGWLYWRKGGKHQHIISAPARLVKNTRHFILAWIGAGLVTYSFAEFVSPGHLVTPVAAMFTGPLAGFLCGNKVIVLLVFVVYSVAVPLGLHEAGVGKDDDKPIPSLSSIADKFHEMRGHVMAPKDKIKTSHFANDDSEVPEYVIKDDRTAQQVSLGTAQLAPRKGKAKRPVKVGLPTEGSMYIYGPPGSGKSVLIQGILLCLRRAHHSVIRSKRILVTKAIATSTKLGDLARSTVPHLVAEGFLVLMMDLTNNPENADGHLGIPTRWSPLSLCKTDEAASHIATTLIESIKESDSKDKSDFWAVQCQLLLYPNLRAAVLAGKDLEWAYRSTLRWSDETFNETDMILFGANGSNDAFIAWQGTRKMLLAKEKGDDLAWKEQAGLGGAGGTGLSIDATLRGVMGKLMNENAYAATRNPNFDIDEWVEDNDTSSVLFMVGAMSGEDEYVTRSIFTTFCVVLLDRLDRQAGRNKGKLKYRFLGIFDEMANLTPIPGIAKVFATLRSKGGQLIAVFQTPSQVKKMLGPDDAKTLVGASKVGLLLPGIDDEDYINNTLRAYGEEVIELKEDSPITRPLLNGTYVTQMRPLDFETGTPGNAVMLVAGGPIELELDAWFLDPEMSKRGVVDDEFLEATEELRAKVNKESKFARAAKDTYAKHKGHANEWWKNRNATSEEPEQKLLTVGSYVPPPPGALDVAKDPSVPPPACANRFRDKMTGEITYCGEFGDLCPICEFAAIRPPAYTEEDVIPMSAETETPPPGFVPVRAGTPTS